MTRLARGGQALRAVACLPAVTGAYGERGGGALLLAAGSIGGGYLMGCGGIVVSDHLARQPRIDDPATPFDPVAAGM